MARSKRPVLPTVPAQPNRSGTASPRSSKEKQWLRFAALFAFGLFFGIFSIAWIGGKTFASYMWLSQLVAGCCVAGLLLPTAWFWKQFRMSRVEVFLFNTMSLGPTLAGLVLWSNFLVIDAPQVQQHGIKSHRLMVDAYAGRTILYALENDAFASEEGLRRVELAEPQDYLQAMNATAISYTIGKGWLGKEVLRNRTVIYPDR